MYNAKVYIYMYIYMIIKYGLPWMISFGHEWGDSSMTDSVGEGMNKMEEILQVAYQNACFWKKRVCLLIKISLKLFSIHLRISQFWYRWWLGP